MKSLRNKILSKQKVPQLMIQLIIKHCELYFGSHHDIAS